VRASSQIRVRLGALLLFVLAAAFPVFADDETFEELLAKAEAPGDRQAELYAKLARRQVEVANEHFNKGEVAQGHTATKEIVNFAGKALDSAKQAKKRLKQTEITLRKTSRRLADVAKTLAFEDRPAVNEAVEEIEGIRNQVLELLFGPIRKPEKDATPGADPRRGGQR
jgi:methionyl-tRNA synthetase